ncbi:hypothetical protein L6R49_29675 [Myxococcota bacterium]|nr:hypothetical protein [Myxococcota bacterium]
MRIPSMTLLLALGACGFERLPDQSDHSVDAPRWDKAVVALNDAVYVMLPQSGGLARVHPTEGWSIVDLNGLTPSRLVATPDREGVIVFGSYPVCTEIDPKIKTVEDCEERDGELELVHEVALVRGGAVVSAAEIAAHFNAVSFTNDGTQAALHLNYDSGADIEVTGVSDLTQVLFMDLDSGAITPVAVGFAADRILFNADDSKAVVLSRGEVLVIELTSGNYDIEVRFPLSLDVDVQVRPQDVALTPDGTYALVTVAGDDSLYVLDLEQESINIVALSSAPTAMVVDAVADRSIFVYSGFAAVDILEHDLFEIQTVPLDEPMSEIQSLAGEALLYSTYGRKDAYLLSLDTEDYDELRLENPPSEVVLSPDETLALAITRPEVSGASGLDAWYDASWGVEIIDLVDRENLPLVAESEPLAVAFTTDAATPTALVLLADSTDLMQLDLARRTASPVELEAPAVGLDRFGDAGFVIVNDAPLGLLSFLDPATGEIITVGGFAAAGILQGERPLPRLAEEE